MRKTETHRRLANRYIGKSPNVSKTMFKNASVDDIINVILYADTLSKPFTDQFAPMLRARTDEDTLRNVWKFVRDNIRYIEDNEGNEIVKSPGKTWQDKTGDCKSMSVMVASLLKNLGYQYYYRVAFYDPSTPNQGHIYPVAVTAEGEEYIVDAVHPRFDVEYTYWKKQDYQPGSGKLSGPPLANKHNGIIAVGAALLLLFLLN